MTGKLEKLFIRACSTGKSDLVLELLRGGLSPETADDKGVTDLAWAARKGQIEVAKALLAYGVDIEAEDSSSRTALCHAVAMNRRDFVTYLASKGANLSVTDAKGWTLFDIATVPKNQKMRELLAQLGAPTRQTPPPIIPKTLNRCTGDGATGGPNLPIEVVRIHIQLSALLGGWRGDYTNAVEFLSFPKYVDGSVVRYTEQMQIVGGQSAKRHGDRVEVKICVPEAWWRQEEFAYKRLLTNAMENGLHSMIALLRRNKHQIDAGLLLADWQKVKNAFLETPAPPFPAEKQRASMNAALLQVMGADRFAQIMGTSSDTES